MDATYRTWRGEQWGRRCLANLTKHDFDAHFFPTVDEAAAAIWDKVSRFTSFGFAGSTTTRALGLLERVGAAGKTAYDHWQAGLSADASLDVRLQQGRCDCFFCSANAIAATGEIVNVDGIGNRTNAMTFGPRKVVIVAGTNKVTADLDSALRRRLREVAGPMRAKSLGRETPCAQTGVCADCNAPQRICRVTTILHRRPELTDISVILINQPLGF